MDSGTIRVRVPAKINLALCVGKKSGQYHPLRTVFQAVSLTDDVSVSGLDDGAIVIETHGPQADLVPTDDTNLCVRAAHVLRERYTDSHLGNSHLGAHIRVDKQIPVAGGMAGGSADAAGTLLALSKLWRIALTDAQLHELAAQVGSDVPFALAGGVSLGQGRGTELTPLTSQGRYHWALAFATRGLSTPAVFAQFDAQSRDTDGSVGYCNGDGTGNAIGDGTLRLPEALLSALMAGDAHALGSALTNDLQASALELHPELAATLTAGRALPGVIGGLVSGSGPTIAFLCESESAVPDVVAALAQFPSVAYSRGVWGPVRGAHFVSPDERF